MLELDLDSKRPLFVPGTKIPGKFRWKQKRRKKISFEIVLLWFTEGTGNSDVGIVSVQQWEEQEASGEVSFQFEAPWIPQSFQGNLIRLKWAIEVKSSTQETARVEFDLTPFESVVTLS